MKKLLKKFTREERPLPIHRNFNRILDDQARGQYKQVIETLFKHAPKMMSRKIPRANIQQAFVFDTVKYFAKKRSHILCVGSFEDTAYEALNKEGYQVDALDPLLNYDLDKFFHLPTTKKQSYDVIFSTSVVEHVENDDLFFKQIAHLLAPGGVAVITCDYQDQYKIGDYVFPGNFRFYTQSDFKNRILPSLEGCSLVDEPNWNCPNPDFFYEGQNYTFATLVFKKD